MTPIESVEGVAQKPPSLFKSRYREQAVQIKGYFDNGQIAQVVITGDATEVNKILSGLRSQLLKLDPELKYYTQRQPTDKGYTLWLSTHEFD